MKGRMFLSSIMPVCACVVLSCCSTSQEGSDGYTSTSQSSERGAEKVTVPSGTVVTVAIDQSLRTDVQQTGDEFTAHTTQPLVINQMTVLPEGSLVRGQLLHVEEPHRTSGKAEMTLSFDEVVDASGESHSLSARPIILEGAGDEISDEEKVAGGAVIGGVIGALSSKDRAKGAATGAAAGAVAGGAIALATKGQQLELPRGQRFAVELTQSITLPVTDYSMRDK